MLMQQVISWICVGVFAATAVLTLLAITNVVKLASARYRDHLFTVLVIEIVAIGVGIFSGYVKSPREVESRLADVGRQQAIAEFKPKIEQVRMLAERLDGVQLQASAAERAQLKASINQLSQSVEQLAQSTRRPK